MLHNSGPIKIFTLLCFALLPSYCFAQVLTDSTKAHAPLETDRADHTEASRVIPVGTLQVESGFLKQVHQHLCQKTTDFFYPITLFRFGQLQRLGLRLITEYHESSFSDESGSVTMRGFNAPRSF
ncbi:hypothetical protein DC20_20665 [Rufibacter tibetensis]|uniref:Uncharacterized protein n=1 Tax=Rufibacter tibetensis TaxID=512763 RepID=A0A0P0CG97_9BACT|nr:hypothetical protein DC20_20665 [Rufibacter tibetensis]